MPILAAYAMPHPPLAVPGVGRGQENGINKTIEAFHEAAAGIAALTPETIIFITPHNVNYADYFHISPGASAWGDFSRFNDRKTRLEAKYDEALAAQIGRLAEESGIPAGSLGEKDANLDHGVCVPLWFIDKSLKDYRIVRISQSGLDPSTHYKLGQVISAAAEATGRKTVLIASSDLSHKLKHDGPYGFAPEGPEFDAIIAKALDEGDFLALFKIPETLREAAAECGYNSLMVLAGCFDRKKVEAKLLSYEGPYGVGYAIASAHPGEDLDDRNIAEQFETLSLDEASKQQRTEDGHRALARRSLEHTVKSGGKLPLPDGLSPELLGSKAGVFVSLYKNGRLRGCIGTIAPTTGSVAEEIIRNAVSAGLQDTRFEPVSAAELPYLTYKVDVLSPPEPIAGPEELDVKRYGVIVTNGSRRGLLLPNLDGIDTVEEQIAIARQKAGISESTPIKLERFDVIRHE